MKPTTLDLNLRQQTRDMLSRVDGNAAEILATTEQGGGVAGQVQKDLGRGWSIAAMGAWMKDTGYAAMARLGWRGQ